MIQSTSIRTHRSQKEQLPLIFTKRQAAKLLGIHFNTLTKYELIIHQLVEDYEAYSVTNSRGEWNRKAPLSLFQLWVLAKCWDFINMIPRGAARYDFFTAILVEKGELLTLENFELDRDEFLAQLGLKNVKA